MGDLMKPFVRVSAKIGSRKESAEAYIDARRVVAVVQEKVGKKGAYQARIILDTGFPVSFRVPGKAEELAKTFRDAAIANDPTRGLGRSRSAT